MVSPYEQHGKVTSNYYNVENDIEELQEVQPTNRRSFATILS